MHGSSPEYLGLLQSHVSALRRKLLEERREQERIQTAIDTDSQEAETLRARIDELHKTGNAERDALKERQALAESGRVAAEACRKEVLDRKFQIQKLKEELEQTEKVAEQEVHDGVQRGTLLLQQEQNKQLEELDAERLKYTSEVEGAEAKLRSLRSELAAEENEAACQIRRSVAAQLCTMWEACRRRHAIEVENTKAADVVKEVETQRDMQKEAFRDQLEEATDHAEASRQEAADLRKSREMKAKRKAKVLHAKIAEARQTLEELEREAAESEAMKERQRRAEFLAAAKLSVARAEAVCEAHPISSVVRKATGHQALHAEFTVIGALQEIDKHISERSAPSCKVHAQERENRVVFD